MAQALVISNDQASANRLANLQVASTGLKVDDQTLASTINEEYQWVEPKDDIFALLFPSASTYHPLYHHDYLEITENLDGAERIKDAKERDRVKAKIKKVVIDSYEIGYMAQCYISLIVCAIILLLYYYTKNINFAYVGIFVGLASVGLYIQATVYGNGEGVAYWNDYTTDLSSRLRSYTLQAVKDQYAKMRDSTGDPNLLSKPSTGNVSVSSNSNGMGSAFFGSLLGSALGSFIKRDN